MEQTTIIPLELSDGTIVRVEATPIGDQEIAFGNRPFKQATDAIKAIAKELSGVLQQEVKPDKATIKFGLEIAIESGQITTLIVKGSSKANLEITLEWSK
jgi:hypothetical protein